MKLILFCLLFLRPLLCHAIDIVRLPSTQSIGDERFLFTQRVLELSLQESEALYGPYELVTSSVSGERSRLLKELVIGERINVHIVATRPEWEEQAIPIMFPFFKGLLGYRLLLIHKDNQPLFSKVEDISSLKTLRGGLGAQWSITSVFEQIGGFTLVKGNNYEGLFGMLSAKRFDYFMRGINEIFGEFSTRSSIYPNMAIEQTLAINIPLPVYCFVSPKHPRLAARILYGLQKMKANGHYDLLFHQHFAQSISQAGLDRRKIFTLPNPTLTPHPIYSDASYWYQPSR